MIYHRKAGEAELRQDMGDTGGGGSSEVSEDAVGIHVYWPQAGYISPVGGVAAYF